MTDTPPVQLFEDSEGGGRFLIYGDGITVRVEVRYEGETLWLTQAQTAELFGVTVSMISRHITNIYKEGELEPAATVSKIETVRMEGGRQVRRALEHYNLDMVISVGYRVSSKQATLFRRWATDTLVRFALKGFVIDAARLKSPDDRDRIAELREIIRDIRSDEANVYRELRAICSMCQDYDGKSDTWHEFYKNTQAKLVYAVCSRTPSEIIRERADASEPNMGLQSWPNDNIRKSDVVTSKNYLSETEVRELNRLTTILLDIFEDQMDIGRLKMMDEAASLLDAQLANLGRSVLRSGGHVSTASAKAHAEVEYGKFKADLKRQQHAEADKVIAEIKASQKLLPKAKLK